MEITINVPRNEYSQPTEPRPEVVQYIVNAFLNNNKYVNEVFHPVSDGYARNRTIHVRITETRKGQICRFEGHDTKGDNTSRCIRFYACEMKAAMNALIKAGWHILEVYPYGSWKGYICSDKPYYDFGGHGSREITAEQFTDFID